MKYLRSYLLVPGAGSQILGSRSSGHRPTRRLTTTHHHSKVTVSNKCKCLPGKRQVSTDGAKNSQLAVVGQVAPALPPPSGAEIESYGPVQRHSGATTCPRHDAKCATLDLAGSRRGNPYFAANPKTSPQPPSYGQFLSEARSLKPSLDPIALEMAFLPTFHAFRSDIGGIFFPNRPKSAGLPYSANVDPAPVSSDVTDTSEFMDVERSKSLEALLPTNQATLSVDDIPVAPTRSVKREIFLPRMVEPSSQNVSKSSFDTFLEVHGFQKRGSEGEGVEKSEDVIYPYPKCEDIPNTAPGSLIIQNDRSSVIIHRDLYITNRILEKLKKMEDKTEITPEPTVKTSAPESVSCCSQADVCTDGQTLLDSAKYADDSVSSQQPCSFPETIASFGQSHAGDPAAGLEPTGERLGTSSNLSREDGHDDKPGGHMANIEFRAPSNRMSALESKAFHARKNLYARMKNASSPCVLVDGVHVKQATLEDVVPKLDKGSTDAAETDSNCFSMVSSEADAANQGVRNKPSLLEVSGPPESNNTLWNPSAIPATSIELENSVPSEVNHNIPETPNIPLFNATFQPVNTDPQFQGILESALPLPLLGQNDSETLQSDIEDWFIPLGKEIESMLLTLEASKNPREYPDRSAQISEENGLIFDEDISNTRGFDTIIESDDLHPFEGIEIIENALMSPRELAPLGSGQSRDKSTISGRLPPKSKNPNVDIKTETTIKCSRSGDNTDINVTETQRYLDKRLPYPFCTETVLQVYGTSDSLSKATQAVESSKAQLVHLNNANSPNPGMLTPKLQFNHMLSKSHENFKPNSKKTVLKIKVVPNTETPSLNPSEPKPQSSHVLQLTEQPNEVSTDVSKLIRRSKFNNKTGPKKSRRGDSVMKFRPKKKINKEPSENIKILSPKDLDKMFPSPPKPKPVEKPRKVTIETKMGKESPGVVETVKQHGSQSGFVAAQMTKSRKLQGDGLERNVPRPQVVTKAITAENEVHTAKSINSKQVSNPVTEAALSVRDQKILQSLISHKVKDSFTAVTKKTVSNQEVGRTGFGPQGSPMPKTPQSDEPKTITGVADHVKVSTKPLGGAARPKSPISRTLDSFSTAQTNYDVDKAGRVYQNDPKTVYATILETAKEKPKEKIPPKVPKPKSPRPDSPTPKPNREYITIKTVPTPKTESSRAASEKVSQNMGNKSDESVLPVSANTVIANVMKSSSDLTQSESTWRHLDQKTALNQTANEHFPREKTPVKPGSDVQRKPLSAKSIVQPKTQNVAKPEVKNVGSPTEKQMTKMDEKFMKGFRDKKVWNLPSDPLFFPFETPNFKEMLEEPPSESRSTHPTPSDSSVPKASAESAVYEADFCKLCTENTPGLAASAPARYRVPLDRMKSFPLLNPGKPKSYTVPTTGAVSINPVHDLMLMRNLRQVPAVTKVLGATLSTKSQQALDRWKEGLISTLGEEGFQEFYRNQLKRGTDFHSAVKKFLVDRFDCQDDLCMRSLSGVLSSVSDVSVIESQVVHPLLGYRGVVDCVAKYKGKPVVIEWKRSDKAKPSLKHTYDAPLQLSAYLGAMNFDSNYKAQQVEGGVVVVAYSDGSPADVFELSVEECERYWAKWLRRLHQYYTGLSSASA